MKPLQFIFIFLTALLLLSESAIAKATHNANEYLLGQKIMLDFRYFCAENPPDTHCNKPVLTLTDDLAEVLVKGQVGGVILFSENIASVEQVITFIYDMQALMRDHHLPPLLIAIDQEGGRVARFPDHMATRFVGNMAIGATFEQYGVTYAEAVASGIAQSMNLLGINVNFAPNVDVNVNPDNPVINVRSYGESPAMVAELGLATVAAFQQHKLISAIKHFPGHGDTHVDSHSGLPRVEHSRNEIEAKDIMPFRAIIGSQTPPAMVMSAHIQYPELDATKLITKTGKETIVPATLSRKILHNVLRKDLAFNGIIITDALDMKAISQFFTPAEATVNAFKAGADIALMPFAIRSKADIQRFWQWQKTMTQAIQSGGLDKSELNASLTRIQRLKKQFQVGRFIDKPKAVRIRQAQRTLPLPENKQLEKTLAKTAITSVFDKGVLPLPVDKHWKVVMPDAARCNAFARSVFAINRSITLKCISLASLPTDDITFDENDILIAGDITPQHATYEMGGMDAPAQLLNRASNTAQHTWLTSAMRQAKQSGATVVMIALRAPYILSDFAELADAALASYGYNVAVNGNQASGAVFDVIAEVLLGKSHAQGSLPVTVEIHSPNHGKLTSSSK